MPNWVFNSLNVKGPIKEVKKFARQAKGKNSVTLKNKLLEFNKFIPIPDNIVNNNELRLDWEKKNWGVKWGACNVEFDDPITRKESDLKVINYWFDTAWIPAELFVEKVKEMFPKLTFELEWKE